MNKNLPEPLQNLVNTFAKLPGFGPKSALRVAMTLLKWKPEDARQFGINIATLHDSLHLCKRCGAFCENDICQICSNPSRQDDQICIVADWDSLLAFESGGFFNGKYVIIGGVISPLDNMPSDLLEIDRLENVLDSTDVKEVIFALGSTLEADTTATFLKSRVFSKYPQIRICRLAQGIPLGQEIQTTDHETLRQALKYRQDI